MAVHEVKAVLQLTDAQEEKTDEIIKRLSNQGYGGWTPEKILSFTVSGLISDLVDEMLARFEQTIGK